MRWPGEWASGALLAVACWAGCSSPTIGSLSIDLVLPGSPDPAADVQSLRIDASWDGGHLAQEVSYADGGVRLDLPTGTPLDLRIEGIATSGGPALWRGQAHSATVPERGNEAVRIFFGKVGAFSHFATLAEMPPLVGTAAVPWAGGQVILAGGFSPDGGASSDIWIYDHQQVRMSRIAGLRTARSWSRALALRDAAGQAFLMVAGGLDQNLGPMKAVELFQPPATHLDLPLLVAPQRLPGGVALDPAGQRILVGCGAGSSTPVTQVQVYLPSQALADGGTSVLAALPLGDDCRGGQLTEARDGTSAFVSGETRGGIERIEWTTLAVGDAGSASSARLGFAAVDSPRGLVLIGGRKSGLPTDEVDQIAINGGTGKLRETRAEFGWLVVPDAGVLLVGGRTQGTPAALASAEWLNLATLTSAPAGQMEVGRIGSAVVQIPGYDAALVVSGEDDSGDPVGGLEIYTYP